MINFNNIFLCCHFVVIYLRVVRVSRDAVVVVAVLWHLVRVHKNKDSTSFG